MKTKEESKKNSSAISSRDAHFGKIKKRCKIVSSAWPFGSHAFPRLVRCRKQNKVSGNSNDKQIAIQAVQSMKSGNIERRRVKKTDTK